jgi:hypothetical protein
VTTASADLAEIRRALAVQLEPGSVAELRVLHAGRDGTVSGYYDDHDALARDAVRWSGRAPGVYVTLNPVVPAFLARAMNRVRLRAAQTTSDREVLRRRWLPIDFDPVRPSGISSTEAEHDAALITAQAVRAELREAEWPDPLFADSGNGAHLLYRIDLPNDAASTALLKRCLESLALRFDDEVVRVDLRTFNAARIWKVYGTLAAKGDATTDRPHRLARLLDAPASLKVVAPECLVKLTAMAPDPPKDDPGRSGYGANFDLERWLARHQDRLRVVRHGPWNGGERWIFNPCPWTPEHTNGAAFLVRFASGAIAAGCHHNECAGRDWHALRDLVEPGWRDRHGDRARRGCRGAHDRAEPPRPPDAPVLVRLADVMPTLVRWLWRDRVPRGKLTLLVGDPGLGKSALALDLAARVTTGADWPAGEGIAEPGTVVILSAEDSLSDTIRPRLDAASADVSRIHALTAVRRGDDEQHFTLAWDVPALESAIATTSAAMVVIDPLSAYFGIDRDSYKDTEVRSLLAPVVALAERTSVAVIAVVHLNKRSDVKALYRVLGSVGFVAAVRGVLAVVPDPDDPDRRLLGVLKSNLARKPDALAFRVASANPGNPDAPPRIEWEPAVAAGLNIETLLEARAGSDDADTRQDAEAFLRELLAHGPVPSKVALQEGRENGLSEPTLRRAKKRLGVRARKEGAPGKKGGQWWWDLPSEGDHAPRRPPEDSQRDPREHLRGTPHQDGRNDAGFPEDDHEAARDHLREPAGGPAGDWDEV